MIWFSLVLAGGDGVDERGRARVSAGGAADVGAGAVRAAIDDPSNPMVNPRIVERGFRGARSDIGGGRTDGDRSNITLVWMHEEGISVGVPFGPLPIEDTIWNNPIIHDERI